MPKLINPRKVLLAIIRADGKLTEAAKALHTRVENIARILDENPEVMQELSVAHNTLYEEALDSAKELLESRDRDMTKFVLDRLGENRGLGKPKQKVQVSGDADNPLVTTAKFDLTNMSEEELAAVTNAMNRMLKAEDDE